MILFHRPDFTYRSAYQLWNDLEVKLKSASDEFKEDIAIVSTDSINFGLNPSATPLIRTASTLLGKQAVDRDLLLSRRRLNVVFSFAGKSRKAAPASIQVLLKNHGAHIARICSEIEHLQQRLRLAKELIQRYRHMKGRAGIFNPDLVLVSPEACEVLFSLWERRVAARDAKLDFLSKNLAARLSNSRRWWKAVEKGGTVSDTQLRELENSFSNADQSLNDDAAIREVLHNHQRLDVFVGNLDWAAEKHTADIIKEACAHGWEKLQARGANKVVLRGLRQIYRRPPKNGLKDLQQIGKRKPYTIKTVENLRPVFETPKDGKISMQKP